MTDEWLIGKDLEGSVHGVLEILSRHFPGGTKKGHKKLSQRFEQNSSGIQVYSIAARPSLI
jgi:hypothetical protein